MEKYDTIYLEIRAKKSSYPLKLDGKMLPLCSGV